MADIGRDSHEVLEALSRKVVKIIVPIVVMLAIDSIITRAIESRQGSAALSRSVFDTMGRSSMGASVSESMFVAFGVIISTVVVTGAMLCLYFAGLKWIILIWLVVAVSVTLSNNFAELVAKLMKSQNMPMDSVTLGVISWNFVVVGNMAIFFAAPHIFTQASLLLIAILISPVFLSLPDWSVWTLLVLLIIYDAIVVLCPFGLLKLLIERAQQRGDTIPALLYSTAAFASDSSEEEEESGNAAEVHLLSDSDDVVLSEPESNQPETRNRDDGIKLGLGDFVFYGALVTRAARMGWDFIFLCSIGILFGLFLTLLGLMVFRKPLPALPCSISIGILFFVMGVVSYRTFCAALRSSVAVF